MSALMILIVPELFPTVATSARWAVFIHVPLKVGIGAEVVPAHAAAEGTISGGRGYSFGRPLTALLHRRGGVRR